MLGKREKSLLPYDYFSDSMTFEWLNEVSLPDYKFWTCSLKSGANLLDLDKACYDELMNQGKSHSECCKILGIKTVPLAGEAHLEKLRAKFRKKKFCTLKDWVSYYLLKVKRMQAIVNF